MESAVGTGDVREEWHSDQTGAPRCALQPGDLQCGSEFRAQLGRDAFAVVLAAGKRW